ncbi:MAG: hypothetical protein NC218_06235 [Acetobacter sp.]|nr:hypothetical protein [Acetobacter sp.]
MNSNQSGRSMIEMLGVLAIVGVLSVGGIAGYSKAMSKAKTNHFISQSSELVMNIRNLYISQHSFEGLNNEALINTGFVPTEMLNQDTSPHSIRHAFSGNVIVYESKISNGLPKAFEIYFTGLEHQACLLLATMDWGQDPASGFQSIYAGVAEISAPLMLNAFGGGDSFPDQNIYTSGLHDDAAPLTVNEASAACNCTTNTCVIGLKYI